MAILAGAIENSDIDVAVTLDIIEVFCTILRKHKTWSITVVTKRRCACSLALYSDPFPGRILKGPKSPAPRFSSREATIAKFRGILSFPSL